MLARLPCRLVIDHVGRFMGPVDPDSEPLRALCRLIDSGTCWIKISAPYESSRSGAPGYDDIAWIARLVARRFPEPPQTPRERDRALGMLVRKGYELELAYDALRRHCGARAESFE